MVTSSRPTSKLSRRRRLLPGELVASEQVRSPVTLAQITPRGRAVRIAAKVEPTVKRSRTRAVLVARGDIAELSSSILRYSQCSARVIS